MSKIVTGLIEPIPASKIRLGILAHTTKKLKANAPLKAPPDFDHPLVRTLVERMPKLSYRELEGVKHHLEKYGDGSKQTSPQVVDGMLFLVNEELTNRDRERERAGENFVTWLTEKGIAK